MPGAPAARAEEGPIRAAGELDGPPVRDPNGRPSRYEGEKSEMRKIWGAAGLAAPAGGSGASASPTATKGGYGY